MTASIELARQGFASLAGIAYVPRLAPLLPSSTSFYYQNKYIPYII
jgi:hypothetical protein